MDIIIGLGSFVIFIYTFIQYRYEVRQQKELDRYGAGRPGVASSVVFRCDNPTREELGEDGELVAPQARTL